MTAEPRGSNEKEGGLRWSLSSDARENSGELIVTEFGGEILKLFVFVKEHGTRDDLLLTTDMGK